MIFFPRAARCVPGRLHRGNGSHVGERAACPGLGVKDLLIGPAQNTRGLGHERDGAEDDVPGVLVLGRLLGKLQRIPDKVGEPDYVVVLVEVGEEEQVTSASLSLARAIP